MKNIYLFFIALAALSSCEQIKKEQQYIDDWFAVKNLTMRTMLEQSKENDSLFFTESHYFLDSALVYNTEVDFTPMHLNLAQFMTRVIDSSQLFAIKKTAFHDSLYQAAFNEADTSSSREVFSAGAKRLYQAINSSASIDSVKATSMNNLIYLYTRTAKQVDMKIIDTWEDTLREALRLNSDDNAIRKNYETIKFFKDMPDRLYNESQKLVAQAKFKEAYLTMLPLNAHPGKEKFKEYMERLQQIVQIEQAPSTP